MEDLRLCRACGVEKQLTEFGINFSYKDNISPKCRKCVRDKVSLREDLKITLQKRTFIGEDLLRCTRCKVIKQKESFHKDSSKVLGYDYVCKHCVNQEHYLKQLKILEKEIERSIDSFEGEIWKDIPGYEGYYMASTMGRIMSMPRLSINNDGVKYLVRKKILSDKARTFGYTSVVLRKDGEGITYRVHRLITLTFLGESDLVVDHINSVRHDNRLENLRYCTPRENTHYASEKRETLSKYVGVSYIKNGKKWVASLHIKGKGYTVGLFATELEAHKAYQQALYDWENFEQVPDYEVRIPKSSCKGVSYHISNKKWEVRIKINKIGYPLGSYDTEVEACEARYKAESEYKEQGILPHYINPKHTSKYKHVHWKEANKKWQIHLPAKGENKKKYGGLFNTEEEAVERVRGYLGLNTIEELLR